MILDRLYLLLVCAFGWEVERVPFLGVELRFIEHEFEKGISGGHISYQLTLLFSHLRVEPLSLAFQSYI